MSGVNRFYIKTIEEIPTEFINEFFMDEIKEFITLKTEAVFGKIGNTDPVTFDEYLGIVNNGMASDSFNRSFILGRLENFASTCKIKEAANDWILDYFYLSCVKQLFLSRTVERVNKSRGFVDFLNENLSVIDKYLDDMSIPAEKRVFGFKKIPEIAEVSVNIDEETYYRDAMKITQNLFVLYHSLLIGIDKSRDNVDYEFEIVADKILFAEIEDLEKRDAVKASKLAKNYGQRMNLFMNLLSLYYIKICTS